MTPFERMPSSHHWTFISDINLGGGRRVTLWVNGGLRVTSELAVAEYPDGDGVGAQWLVSVSFRGKRPADKHVRAALKDFGMSGAEEDNHEPGIARKFWLPVDPIHRVACQCKADELTVVEPDGYRWTTPVDGPCHGCEHQRLFGKPCPVHVTRKARVIAPGSEP